MHAPAAYSGFRSGRTFLSGNIPPSITLPTVSCASQIWRTSHDISDQIQGPCGLRAEVVGRNWPVAMVGGHTGTGQRPTYSRIREPILKCSARPRETCA
jgi:hypothetical protein